MAVTWHKLGVTKINVVKGRPAESLAATQGLNVYPSFFTFPVFLQLHYMAKKPKYKLQEI